MNESYSSFCFYIAGTLLIMLMLNLFLWEKVASVPVYTSVSGYDGMSLNELLDHVVTESNNIRDLTAEMHRIFVSTSLIFGSFTKWTFKPASAESHTLLESTWQQNQIIIAIRKAPLTEKWNKHRRTSWNLKENSWGRTVWEVRWGWLGRVGKGIRELMWKKISLRMSGSPEFTENQIW